MTAKERVDATFRFKEVDCVPVVALDGGVWLTNQEGISFDNLIMDGRTHMELKPVHLRGE